MAFDPLAFFLQYKWVILFYSFVILLISINRKKFEIQAKIIALYRTSIGLKLMDRIAGRQRELLRVIGYTGIGICYFAMIGIIFLILQSLWKLFTVPDAPPGIGLIIPGIHIPGSPVFVPLWYGLIALFCVVLVHEFSHGIIARVHKIPVKSSGIVFFGPLIGAFVEPDEEDLRKRDDITQYSVFAAGPFSNILLAVIIALILNFAFFPLQEAITEPVGFSFDEIQDGYPAQTAGLEAGMIIQKVNGEDMYQGEVFLERIASIKPNETIILESKDESFEIITAEHPDNDSKGYIGIVGIRNESQLKNQNWIMNAVLFILTWIMGLFKWIFVLSLGIGLANLLPLGPVDGGRMLQVTLQKIKGEEKGNRLWKKISILCLTVLLLNIFFPAIRYILGLFL